MLRHALNTQSRRVVASSSSSSRLLTRRRRPPSFQSIHTNKGSCAFLSRPRTVRTLSNTIIPGWDEATDAPYNNGIEFPQGWTWRRRKGHFLQPTFFSTASVSSSSSPLGQDEEEDELDSTLTTSASSEGTKIVTAEGNHYGYARSVNFAAAESLLGEELDVHLVSEAFDRQDAQVETKDGDGEKSTFSRTRVDSVEPRSRNDDTSNNQRGAETTAHHVIDLHALNGHLERAIKFDEIDTSMELFYIAIQMNHTIRLDVLSDLLNLLLLSFPKGSSMKQRKKQNQFLGYVFDVFRLYQDLSDRQNKPVDVNTYRRICHAIAELKPRSVPTRQLKGFVRHLTRSLLDLDQEVYQHCCLPSLVLSLVKQSASPEVGLMALPIYEYMERKNFPVDIQIYENILAQSKYTRQGDLPYPKVLRALLSQGHRPDPTVMLNALQNLYPFTDMKAITTMFGAVLDMQRSKDPSDPNQSYTIDMGTLEQITAAGAKVGSPNLVLLVWDYMELMTEQHAAAGGGGCGDGHGHGQYRPTEAIYENTVQAFVASTKRQDHNAFAVLAEMEREGYVPTRALIRSVSRSIGKTVGRTDNAYYILINKTEGTSITTSSLNCILSACAENGLVDRAFATFDDFAAYSVQPNADTFSFLLEALAVDIAKTIPFDAGTSTGASTQQGEEASSGIAALYGVEPQLEAADEVLDMMDEMNIPINHHVLHQYIRILCCVNEPDKARALLEDANERIEGLSDESFELLAAHYAQIGNFEAAKHVASQRKLPSYLSRFIDKLEKEKI